MELLVYATVSADSELQLDSVARIRLIADSKKSVVVVELEALWKVLLFSLVLVSK